jgi:hypothetical protein
LPPSPAITPGSSPGPSEEEDEFDEFDDWDMESDDPGPKEEIVTPQRISRASSPAAPPSRPPASRPPTRAGNREKTIFGINVA